MQITNYKVQNEGLKKILTHARDVGIS